ncbi:hypothetical protein QU42_00255 [Bradyrhizobium sp. UASWS1016]|uniref:GAP1-N1 domain-containing protein n=1 Tax=Bradyrhizobium sp. UASWS1016 TaxID=1566379 RepID=UPI0008574C01|nr:hypothetical protein [Bradyrhizobium sp. UASWS1016]OCX33136.1 hypothetical protein QU42_00255 [Bradyrhizobium sp. UASWS1016]
MITIDTQIHGYRQGHELLASSASLSKADQAIVDRLSDIAGPLRPGEVFEPYLTTYPLPSGRHHVLARTWQDTGVPRAGCVKTFSLLIPKNDWASAQSLLPFVAMLNSERFPKTAEQLSVLTSDSAVLPPVPPFQATELLEALFLEEPKPVAIFDAPMPELIAIRLLTALWPSLRSQFSLSTFALSPRKIEGRSFDLVFAPKDARPRFSDWPGRRIDARAGHGARHRWTGAIVSRVFSDSVPRLLDDRELRIIGKEETNSVAALRIALLWEELLGKLESSPAAALGLLDIANSKMQGDAEAVLMLQPALVDAAHRAVRSLPASEAWGLIGAMARKMHGTQLAPAIPSVAGAAATLASASPSGAIALLDQPDPQGAIHSLVPEIARGLSEHFNKKTEEALKSAPPEIFGRVIGADKHLAEDVAASDQLVKRLSEVLPDFSPKTFDAVREAILPFLIRDTQIAAATPLLLSLSAEALLKQANHMAISSQFEARNFFAPLVARARELEITDRLWDALISTPVSVGRDDFLSSTLAPTSQDVERILADSRLDRGTAKRFLLELLRKADSTQFRDLFANHILEHALLASLSTTEADLLGRTVREANLSLTNHVSTVLRLLPISSDEQKFELARSALDRCLRDRFDLDEIPTIAALIDNLGSGLDGAWLAWRGLENSVSTFCVNRNLVAFGLASIPARAKIIEAIEEVARALETHHTIGFDQAAADSCAALLWDAHVRNSISLLRASGRLLPKMLRAQHAPVSAVIAATFPSIYRELAKEDEVPNILKFVPFFDWDRCKAARRELVDAFLASPQWRPADLALTACRSSDVDRIIGRLAKSGGGDIYMRRVYDGLANLPPACRDEVTRKISRIRGDMARD